MRLPRRFRAHPDEAVQQAALFLEVTVERNGPCRFLAARLRQPLSVRNASGLPRLPVPQQFFHLLGLEQPRNSDEVEFLETTDRSANTELPTVEEHPVEGGLRLERFEVEQQCITGCRLDSIRIICGVVVEQDLFEALARITIERVVAFPFERRGQGQ